MEPDAATDRTLSLRPPKDGAQLSKGQRAMRRRSTLSHIAINQRVVLTLDGHQQLTIGEFTDKVGFGSYQLQVFVMSFGALMVESSTIAMVSGCVDPISKEFEVEGSLAKAAFTSLLYLGIQLGTVLVGGFVDRFGRRKPLLLGYFGMALFGICSCFATGVKSLYALLFLTGFFAGLSVPCSVIMLSEVVPAGLRGTCSAALGISFRVGALWTAVALRIWMPELDDGPWRWLLAAAVLPAGLFFVFSLVSPAARQDTPHFLAIAGQGRALVSTLNLMADTNHRQDLRLLHSEEVRCDKEANSVTLREVVGMMSTYPLWFNFLIMVTLFFCKEFVAGGTTAYWPVTFAHLHRQSVESGPKVAHSRTDHFRGQSLVQVLEVAGFIDPGVMSAASELIVTALVSFPGILVAMWAMHFLERRLSLTMGAVLTGIGALLLLCLYSNSPVAGLFGVGIIQLFFPIWQMCTMLLGSEVFPTQVRGQAYSASYFIGRFGSEVAQLAVHSGVAVFPAITAGLAVTAMTLVYCLPETKDVELTNFVSEEKTPALRETPGYGSLSGSSAAGAGRMEKEV